MADDPNTDPSANADPNANKPDPKPDPDDGGKGGKTALLSDLASERDRRQAAEKAAKDAAAELDKIRKQHMSDAEKAVAQAKEEGRAEALSTANERLLKAEVRAAAAGKLADPNIAVRLLDLSEFEVSADGDVDTKAITKAIDGLAKQYPALAANGGGPGDGDGGARSRSATGNSMNTLIRDRMRR